MTESAGLSGVRNHTNHGSARPAGQGPRCLLIGPYDPHNGEYTFLAPPLGVWRLAGVLDAAGVEIGVFDPNCCDGDPAAELADRLRSRSFDAIGISTTGMTLQFDLELAHLCRRLMPAALIVAGGMEATFRPDLMFELGPFDLVVLGEGEKPLVEIARRWRAGSDFRGISGTAHPAPEGLRRYPQAVMSPAELRSAVACTPYHRMPYHRYWERLERAYRVGALPTKAEREARLAEIRSVRLITLNYCPMGCTFCSSTNFLHEAQGGTAAIARLDAEACVDMIRRIVSAQPSVRTIIFQDDIFVFTKDPRILPLCKAIVEAKRRGDLPTSLRFISTNRIDAMNGERLTAMRAAGFGVLGFGIESFSASVLQEFNKARIVPHIEPMLSRALSLGITPFLDLILTSPRATMADFATTVREAYRWILAGCEVGSYPYVIPFSGAALAGDPSLVRHTTHARRRVRGTDVAWDQPAKILPIDATVRAAILEIEEAYERQLTSMEGAVTHLPSRLRSLLWIACATPVLARAGETVPAVDDVLRVLEAQLPGPPATNAPSTTLGDTWTNTAEHV